MAGSPKHLAPELKSGAVQVVLTDWLLPTVDLWALFPTGRQASAKARAFASFVETQMSVSGFGAFGSARD
jgi:DNA-binding transcriptional LysR family regulator